MYPSVHCDLAEESDFATSVILICFFCEDGHLDSYRNVGNRVIFTHRNSVRFGFNLSPIL
jgi:hypothetical protein